MIELLELNGRTVIRVHALFTMRCLLFENLVKFRSIVARQT